MAWSSGSGGAVLRTTDGGKSWRRLAAPPGGATLDFRDVQAFDERRALLLAAGPGAASGLWRTADAGRNWEKILDCPWPEGFFDGIAFWSEREGVLVGDPVDGALLILRTDDGGATWVRARALPPPVPGEFAFAASGTSACALAGGRVWLGTGGAGAARVWRSVDGGRSWDAVDAPLFQGLESAGVFSVAFADAMHGVIVGGDYLRPNAREKTAAWTEDGGRSWIPAAQMPAGYRSCVAAWNGGFVCTGPGGTDWSADGGRTWSPLAPGFHAVAPPFAAGADGRLARLPQP